MDSDAAAYCARSGAADRIAINAFVRGVKALGLWSNMVCWPLRSSQNAGTGTTAFSLGGLGTFNGTLVNGPTWGADGVALTEATQSITRSGFDTPGSPMTFGIVNDKSNTAAQMRLGVLGGIPKRAIVTEAVNTRSFDIRNASNNQLYLWLPSPSTAFLFKSVSIAGNVSANGYLNGSAISPASSNLAGAGWDDAAGNSTELVFSTLATDATIRVAFMFIASGLAATAAQQASLHTLYRATLGTGLGLP
jgi:hypothetical protein